MGFFKKIFRPVSKVLDKVVPNEIKPFLPYAAAFAPYLAGPGMGGASGFQGILANPYLRAAMSGGLNIGSQLAQEGNEGEINALSAGLGALQGFGTAAGAQDALTGFKTPAGATKNMYLDKVVSAPELSGIETFKNKGLDMLIGGADKLQSAGNVLRGDGLGFNKATLQAAGLPVAQATGDVMYAENTRAMKDYEQALADYESSAGELANDEGRALAIRAAMEAGQHSEDIIIETLQSLGLYAHGGRVRAMGGGLMNAKRGLVDAPGGYAGITEIENMREFRIANPNIEDVADYKGYYDRKNNPEKYDEDGFEIKEEIKEKFTAPDFGGITEAVGNIEEEKQLMAGRAKDLFMLRDEAIMREDFDKIQEIELDFFKEFGIEMPVSQNESSGPIMAAQGGRIGFDKGGPADKIIGMSLKDSDENKFTYTMEDFDIKRGPKVVMVSIPGPDGIRLEKMIKSDAIKYGYNIVMDDFDTESVDGGVIDLSVLGKKDGGRIGKYGGGMMSVLPQGMEMDYRGGGFIPMGSKEKADDVPARVSKNEFVMTADAVRAAGGGSVNQGAKRMYNLMNNLEARA